MIVFFIFVCIIFLIICFEIYKWKVNQTLKDFVAPKEIPVFGIAHRIIGKSNENVILVLNDLFNETYWQPFRAWYGPFRFIGLSDVGDVQKILSSSISSSDNDIWQNQFGCVFGSPLMSKYLLKICTKAKIFVENETLTETSRLNVCKEIYKCVVDSVASSLFGIDLMTQSISGSVLYENSKDLHDLSVEKISNFWLNVKPIFNCTSYGIRKQFSTELLLVLLRSIQLQKSLEMEHWGSQFDGKENENLNFLEKCLRMKNANQMDDQEISEKMKSVFLNTVNLITNGIHLVLLMLAIHPKYQEKLFREIKDFSENSNDVVEEEQLNKLSVLDSTVKETFRLFPLVPFVMHETTNEISLKNCTVPANARVLISIYHLHRDPKVWTMISRQFEPMRFMADNELTSPDYAFIPFGLDPVTCFCQDYIMMSIKTILIFLIQKYEFSTDLQLEDVRIKFNSSAQVTNENAFRIKERKKYNF